MSFYCCPTAILALKGSMNVNLNKAWGKKALKAEKNLEQKVGSLLPDFFA